MSSSLHGVARVAVLSAMLALSSQLVSRQAWAQGIFGQRQPAVVQPDDVDPETRIQQLENQLRQLTGQNEELQFRNRQLEDQLRQVQAGGVPPGGAARANVAAAQSGPAPRQPQVQVPQPSYDQQIAAPAPIVQDQGVPAAPQPGGRRRGDAFDPNQNPNAPGAPRALGGGQLPVAANPVGVQNGRGAGEPLDLANTSPRNPNLPNLPNLPPQADGQQAALTTLPPSTTPKDEFDLGIGYMQRRDYALAEETMRNFAQKYPGNPLIADSQYWLGESFFQRQRYRDAAESFLGVTTKFDTSAKAPDSLLRLGQSLAALKEKEAACAAFGEVGRKYPRASQGVKQAVDREQKRVKC